jgi:hypothetical protein
MLTMSHAYFALESIGVAVTLSRSPSFLGLQLGSFTTKCGTQQANGLEVGNIL